MKSVIVGTGMAWFKIVEFVVNLRGKRSAWYRLDASVLVRVAFQVGHDASYVSDHTVGVMNVANH